MLITQVVAPGEWFITPAQQAAMNFQGNFMGMGFMGMGFMGMGGFMGMNFMGMNFMGNFQGPPPPVHAGRPRQSAEGQHHSVLPHVPGPDRPRLVARPLQDRRRHD